jgi:hypothetical protein
MKLKETIMSKDNVAKKGTEMQDENESGMLIFVGLLLLAALIWYCKWGVKL